MIADSQRQPITIIKNDHNGREVWRYEGHIILRKSQHIVLEAHFNRADVHLEYITFRRGDRFVEHFYSDRWYNIFEIHDVDDDDLKGWYCNITRPAFLGDNTIRADDLALDLFVSPDGQTRIIDGDEFDALPISQEERAAAQAALEELQQRVREGNTPFTLLTG